MSNHTVSVVIPTYNRAHLIERALRSVMNQTFPVHEIIVVDDGSEDGTDEVVRRLALGDQRVSLTVQTRKGAPAARNLGIGLATGSLIAFQDSDDEWRPTFVADLVALHVEPHIVAFSSLSSIDESGVESVAFPTKITDVDAVLMRTNCISTQTAIVDATLFSHGGFDVALPRLQDWDLWLGLIGKAQFIHFPLPLAVQYLQADSITKGDDTLYEALRVITRKHWRVMMRRPYSFARLWLAARWHKPQRSVPSESAPPNQPRLER